MKKTTYLLFLFFLIGKITLAQNWTPLNLTDKYHYQNDTSDYISNTLWIDSFDVVGNDSIFYLNRIAVSCDTCQNNWVDSTYPIFKLINQGQFLQKQMIKKSNGDFLFRGNRSILIRPNTSLNDTWLVDTINNIFAEVITIEEQMILGNMDSVKTIQFSNNQEVLLSKSHGFISFSDLENGISHDLRGIEGRNLGEQIPDIFDFYNFEIGDVFQYRYDYGNCAPCFYVHRLWKETIISKEVYPDSMVYEKEVVTNGWDTTIIEKFVIAYDSTHPTNYYNLQMTPNPSEDEDYFLDNTSISLDENGLITKTFGTYYETSFGDNVPLNYVHYNTPSNDIIQATDGGTFHIYKEGLGQVRNGYSVFETSSSLELEGYVKNGDTTGIVFSDFDVINSVDDLKDFSFKFNIFPNPASNYFQLSFSQPISEKLSFQVLSIDGKIMLEEKIQEGLSEIRIDVSSLRKGIYFLTISGVEKYAVRKIVIQKE